MPQIIINIDEQMEAKINDAIQQRKDFFIDGGMINLFNSSECIPLKGIMFHFDQAAQTTAKFLDDVPLSVDPDDYPLSF